MIKAFLRVSSKTISVNSQMLCVALWEVSASLSTLGHMITVKVGCEVACEVIILLSCSTLPRRQLVLLRNTGDRQSMSRAQKATLLPCT